MRSIELQTTQNVTINYDLALLRDRVLAFLIDFVVLVAVSIFLILVLFQWVMRLDLADEFYYLLIMPIITFYSLALESLNDGQTLGKMALRIKVVRVDGKQMKFNDYLLRWIFRLLDIWFSGGAIAVVMVSSSPKAQRIGGLVSNSTVVKSNPGLYVSLGDIMKINTKSNYQPQFPEVRHFREQDMLTIKQTVERYLKYKNDAHREALNEVTRVVCEKLQIDPPTGDKVRFLKGLIKDYIVLTR
ncbi:MAG: RDD family protein [Flavobacteriales bacterium]|nr:RDD family protein [Flavobacteriales bacterium]